MHGGSRHGPRGQAHSGSRNAGGRSAQGRTRPGKAPAPATADVRSAAEGEAGSGKTPAALPDADRLSRLLEPVVRAMGMDLESVRVTAAGRRRLLRVVVDADGGVSLDAIALASRELSARLDRASEMGELPYTLEVSSPGIDRPLTEPRHWRRAIGRLVVAPLKPQPGHHGGNGAATVSGRVAGSSLQGVTLDCQGVLREYRFSELGPGRVQVEFGHLGPGEDEERFGEEQDEED